MSKVLITGGAGFIGSHTADLLLKKNYQVRILDNLILPVHIPGQWPDYLDDRIEKVYGDVRKREDWERALVGIDYVIHLAAYQDLVSDFSTFFSTNAVGTSLLYEIIVAKNLPVKKVVVASTQFVYGEGRYQCEKCGLVYPQERTLENLMEKKWDPICPKCFSEQIQPCWLIEKYANPGNQYSIAKYTQEMIALRLGKNYNIPSVAMRYSIVQGPRQSFRNAYSGVLRIFTLKLMKDEAPTIYEDGQQLRDYINVDDVSRANLKVLEDDRANYENYNVGGGKGYTVIEFYNIVQKVLGTNIKPNIAGEFRRGDTRHSVSDISKLMALGWEPTKTPKESVQEYVEWIKTQKMDRDYVAEAEANLRKLGTVLKAVGD